MYKVIETDNLLEYQASIEDPVYINDEKTIRITVTMSDLDSFKKKPYFKYYKGSPDKLDSSYLVINENILELSDDLKLCRLYIDNLEYFDQHDKYDNYELTEEEFNDLKNRILKLPDKWNYGSIYDAIKAITEYYILCGRDIF